MARKKMTPLDAVEDLQQRNHRITKGSAEKMVKAFEKQSRLLSKALKNGTATPEQLPDWPKCWTFNKKLFQMLLKKPDAQGIRFFPAIADDGGVTLVVVAVDSQGNNIKTAEQANPTKAATAKKALALRSATTELDNNAFDEAQRNPPYPGDTSL